MDFVERRLTKLPLSRRSEQNQTCSITSRRKKRSMHCASRPACSKFGLIRFAGALDEERRSIERDIAGLHPAQARDEPRFTHAKAACLPTRLVQGAPRIHDQRCPAISRTLVDEKTQAILQPLDGSSRKNRARCNPYHLIFSIWALTQHYADFDVQVHAVLGGPEIDPYPEALRYLETLFTRMLTP